MKPLVHKLNLKNPSFWHRIIYSNHKLTLYQPLSVLKVATTYWKQVAAISCIDLPHSNSIRKFMPSRIRLKKKLIILTTSDHLSNNDRLVNLSKLTIYVSLNDRLLVSQRRSTKREKVTELHKLQSLPLHHNTDLLLTNTSFFIHLQQINIIDTSFTL